MIVGNSVRAQRSSCTRAKRASVVAGCVINPGFRDQAVVGVCGSVVAAPVVFDGLLEPACEVPELVQTI